MQMNSKIKVINKLIKRLLFIQKYNSGIDVYNKTLSLSILVCGMEEYFHEVNNKNFYIKMEKILKFSTDLFYILQKQSNFKEKIYKHKVFTDVIKNHKNLWGEIWPDYTVSHKDFMSLVNFRKKRYIKNNISQYIKNSDVIEFGCGGGSNIISCYYLGAKSITGLDYNSKNILSAKSVSKKLGIKNYKFITKNITKLKNNKKKKKYDFIICNAVLHHLKNHNSFQKALKIMSSYGKKNSYFFIYVTGKGGIRDKIQNTCYKIFKKSDAMIIKKTIKQQNYNTDKFGHLLDWFKARYLETTPKQLLKMASKANLKVIKKFERTHQTDYDFEEMELRNNKLLLAKFGTGDLRYLFKLTK
jgi:ubiquinone/menaquinone biosynthesis C-methylase UbiE